MNPCTTINLFSFYDKISKIKAIHPCIHSPKQNEDTKVLYMSAKQIIVVVHSRIGWFSYKAWLRRRIKTSVGERVGRRHLGGRFIKKEFFFKGRCGRLMCRCEPEPAHPPPNGIWGGRAKGAGGTDSSDSVSPEEVLACEAPFANTFTLNHPIPRPGN